MELWRIGLAAREDTRHGSGQLPDRFGVFERYYFGNPARTAKFI